MPPRPEAASADPATAFPARTILWVVALAAVVRLVYFAESARSPFFAFPVLDEAYYDALGRALASGGDVGGLDPGFRPLLYGGVLAATGPLLAKALQHLAGIATAALVALLAIRLSDRAAAGAVAGGLWALAGPPLFYEGQLLPDSLFALAVLASVLLATRRATVGAGCAVGIAAELRPNGLAFLAAFPLLARLEKPRRWRAAGVAVGAGLAVAVVAALAQMPFVGRFQLVPSAGGVNLYLGNERGADGMFPRQDRAGVYGDAYRDSVQVFAEEAYREAHPEDRSPSPSAVSRYWVGRTFDEVGADPGRWLGLLLKKSWLLLWNREVANNLGYDFVRRAESPLLRALPVRWWMLLALVPAGVVVAWRTARRPLVVVAVFGLLHAATTVAFFVNGRYRLPLWPLAAALAGVGAVAMFDAFRRLSLRSLPTSPPSPLPDGRGAPPPFPGIRRSGSAIAPAIAAGVLLAGLSLADFATIPADSDARDVYYRSLAHLAAGDPASALADVEASLALDPEEPAAYLQRGLVLLRLDRPADALADFEQVVRRRPEEPRGHNARGIALERLGRDDDAYRAYLAAATSPTGFAPAARNAALLALRAGRLDEAASLLARGAEEGDVASLVAAAEIARRRGDPSAASLLARARSLDPEATDRLLADLARPATLTVTVAGR